MAMLYVVCTDNGRIFYIFNHAFTEVLTYGHSEVEIQECNSLSPVLCF